MSILFYLALLYFLYRVLNSRNPFVQLVVLIIGLYLVVKLFIWFWGHLLEMPPLFFVFFFAFILVAAVLYNLKNALKPQ